MSDISGLLVVDKPSGITSYDVIREIKRIFGMKRVGHCGTLDPMATGILLVMLGKATRLAQFTNHYRKVYVGKIRLGETTDTDDADGAVLVRREVPELPESEMYDAIKRFIGEGITQRVPAYSAVKVNGERLYKKARRGDEIITPVREVDIYRIDVLDITLPYLELKIECGSGTYIRSIARDIGEILGCGGHLCELQRFAIGRYDISGSVRLDSIASSIGDNPAFHPIGEILYDMPKLNLEYDDAKAAFYGRGFTVGGSVSPGKVRLMYNEIFIGIANVDDGGIIRIEKGFLDDVQKLG